MSPMQQIFLGLGKAPERTYIDDAFLTHLYGYSSSATITTNIDLTENGGMLWIKNRTNDKNHCLADTVTGSNKLLLPNGSNAQEDGPTGRITNITSTGFTLGSDDEVKSASHGYTSWNFARTPGFFDIVTYTGNGSGRNISHSLGCVPGMILVKCLSHSAQWAVYHRGTSSFPQGDGLYLNGTDGIGDITGTDDWWDGNNRQPTATTFGVGTNTRTNQNTRTYVAYLFAGGESTAATARSVEFDGSGDYLTIPTTSNMEFATGDYTIDFWFKRNATGEMAIYDGTDGGTSTANRRQRIYVGSDGKIAYYDNTPRLCKSVLGVGTWNHVAVTRASGTSRIFINGTLEQSWSSSGDNHKKPDSDLYIGRYVGGSGEFNGSISNLRMIKGHAAYTSSFIPPTEPPTSTSDGASGTEVKFLGCNDSSVTGAHINLLNTITSNGNPTASTDSPFDDPAAFTFGDSGNQNVIKCGSYVGNGSSTGPEINLGWEPQWVLIKGTDTASNWTLLDCMRGIVTGGNDMMLKPNANDEETTSNDYIELTPTGFKIKTNVNQVNKDGDNYVYTCIRRPDGYVGKPPELGTDVFAMDTSSASSVIPTFDSTFPVDFGLKRKTASTDHWLAGYRLLGQKSLSPDRTNSETDSGASLCWDSNLGFGKTFGTLNQGWMWKRHAGFDVVTYIGSGDGDGGKPVSHSLSKTPEMVWIKRRDGSSNWFVYHLGANGGTNPENYALYLNTDGQQVNIGSAWMTPTATHITFGSDSTSYNRENYEYLMMLFDSVDGISKVGYYTGNASGNVALNCGFVPRFFMTKAIDANTGWLTVDSTRDVNMGKRLFFDSTAAETSYDAVFAGQDYIESNKTGLSVNGVNYVFYAHK